MFAGVVLVAGMALTGDFVLGWIQRRLTSPGLSVTPPRPGPMQDAAALATRAG
jgi:hypothetical protein